MKHLLTNKTAAVFAASGAIAGAVAKSFAEQGAHTFVSARNLSAAQNLAAKINAAGGKAEAAQVDAMDEFQIDSWLSQIATKTGRMDVVFNGIGLRPSLNGYGLPSMQLSFEQFMEPLKVHAGSQFLTSRSAAKIMAKLPEKGTILLLTASLSRLKLPFMAGVTASCTAIEGLTRVLAAEYGQMGIRVLCMNPTSLPETRTIQETGAATAASLGLSPEQMAASMSTQYLLGRGPELKEVGQLAAFLASNAGAILNSHIIDADRGSSNVI